MSMQSAPHAASGGDGAPIRRRSGRASVLAVLAILSVLALVDSEALALAIPGIFTATDLMHVPVVLGYAALAVLVVAVLWLSVHLALEIWRVEHALWRDGQAPSDAPPVR